MLENEAAMAEGIRAGAVVQSGFSLYVPQLARVITARRASPTERFFQVDMENGHPLNHRPGQFVEVSVPGVGEAPFSICTSPTEGPGFGLCIRKIGLLTTYLHGLAYAVLLARDFQWKPPGILKRLKLVRWMLWCRLIIMYMDVRSTRLNLPRCFMRFCRGGPTMCQTIPFAQNAD